MRKAKILFNNILAGTLIELENKYIFEYSENYQGPAIALTLPLSQKIYHFNEFPVFFANLLPEGQRLETLLQQAKLNRQDYLGQLLTVGADMIGAITVEKHHET